MMPEGVEHIASARPTSTKVLVTDSMMPEGVEHKTVICIATIATR